MVIDRIDTLEEPAMELSGKKIAILATTGFEQSELEVPRDTLKQAGATVEIVRRWRDQRMGQEGLGSPRQGGQDARSGFAGRL
jgi:putative intracellular protease/amidase